MIGNTGAVSKEIRCGTKKEKEHKEKISLKKKVTRITEIDFEKSDLLQKHLE